MADGDPIAVTLVEEDLFGKLGGRVLPLPSGRATSVLQLFRTLFSSRWDQWFALVIANGLSSPLVMQEQQLFHCDQTFYPAESDLVGAWYTDGPYKGKSSSDGVAGNTLPTPVENQIPGTRPHPLKSATLYGVGAYSFYGPRVLWGTDGVMSFSCAGLPTMAMAWSFGDPAGGPNVFAVTADLSAYSSDVKTFYDQTVGANKTVSSDATGQVRISAAVTNGNIQSDFYDPNLSSDPMRDSLVIVVRYV